MQNAIPLPPPIQLPAGIARTVEPLWRTVALALAGLVARFGAIIDVRRLNWGPNHVLGRRIAELRRLQGILRCVLIVYASELVKTLVLKPLRKTKAKATRPTPREVAGDPATWRVGFVTPRWVKLFSTVGEEKPQPAVFASAFRAQHNPFVTMARKMEGLRRVLADPMPHIRRLARRVKIDIYMFPKRAKRRPPADRRAWFDELCQALHDAWWATTRQNPYNYPRHDTS